jgi:hypothetical protein
MGFKKALFYLAATTFCHPAQSSQLSFTCPNESQGETAEDCPWAGIARTLIQQADTGQALGTSFDSLLPEFKKQLVLDSKHEHLKALWDQSLNYDEYAKDTIVHPAILDLLTETLQIAPREGILVHAGMEHIYGYLFSVLKTPFGYKRARWVRDDIETGFELPRGALGPTPTSGTMFTNVTYFIGQIALKDDATALQSLREEGTEVLPEVLNFNFSRLQPIRLEETVFAPPDTRRVVKLRTDLVPFLNQHSERLNSHLLIYSVLDLAHMGAKLVTAFPVDPAFVNRVLNPETLGENKPITTRYNAHIEGVTGVTPPLLGVRRIISNGN